MTTDTLHHHHHHLVPMPSGIPFPELYQTMMNWRTPVAGILMYLTIVYLWTIQVVKKQQQSKKISSSSTCNEKMTNSHSNNSKHQSSVMTFFVLLHNIALASYSGLTFYKMVTALDRTRSRDDGTSLFVKVCDLDEYHWNDALGYWGYFFYLSKFYEFIDTFIILLKGRKPSLLQEYHHAGAIITMWAGIRYRTTAIWLFVTFNSFIHTLMYTYYASTTMGFHPPGKKYLTTLQISQFLLGMTVAALYLLTPGCSETPGEQFTLKLNLTYLMPLTFLFLDFARKTYGRHQQVNSHHYINKKTT